MVLEKCKLLSRLLLTFTMRTSLSALSHLFYDCRCTVLITAFGERTEVVAKCRSCSFVADSSIYTVNTWPFNLIIRVRSLRNSDETLSCGGYLLCSYPKLKFGFGFRTVLSNSTDAIATNTHCVDQFSVNV